MSTVPEITLVWRLDPDLKGPQELAHTARQFAHGLGLKRSTTARILAGMYHFNPKHFSYQPQRPVPGRWRPSDFRTHWRRVFNILCVHSVRMTFSLPFGHYDLIAKKVEHSFRAYREVRVEIPLSQ